MKISFNKPYFTGKETKYIQEAVADRKVSGNGRFTKLCQEYFQNRFEFGKCLLTTSCTDALEMSAILLDIQPGDEVIVPSYTFVSTANAFVLRGAKIRFADSMASHPNVDVDQVRQLISKRTKAIVVVHYGGVACDMAALQSLVKEHGIYLVEDAAQAIDSRYESTFLGTFGDISTFSFHETKNISSGEGGLLVINNERFQKRAEIIWEKGTNRAAFFRGEVDKYTWVDIGSSFLPSDIIAACLFAQLEELDDIQSKRIGLWKEYERLLSPMQSDKTFKLFSLPNFATNNGHLFPILCASLEDRSRLISHLKKNNIDAVFHYVSLHSSTFYAEKHDGRNLPNCDKFSDRLLRLPLYYELRTEDVHHIVQKISDFFKYDD